MLTEILTALVIIAVVLVVVVALQPTEFRIVRSASVSAPPAVVFAQVNDLGGEFEKGLANLKSVSEAAARN